MAAKNVDDLLAAIRALPLAARRALIERATHEAEDDTPKPGVVAAQAAASADSPRFPVRPGHVIGSLDREDLYADGD